MPRRKLTRIQHAIGIDISDGSIEICDIIDDQGNAVLKNFGRILLDKGTVVSGIIHEEQTLFDAFRSLIAKRRLPDHGANVIIGIPDSQIIAKRINIENTRTHNEVDTIVQEMIQAIAPNVRKATSRWTSVSLERGGGVWVYVTSDEFIAQWRRFFKRLGFQLVAAEMQSHALKRALVPNRDSNVTGLLDFGYRTTSLTVHADNQLLYSHTTDLGGHDLNVTLASSLECTEAQAEKLKIQHGLVGDPHKNIAQLLKTELDEIIDEMKLGAIIGDQGIQRLVTTGGGASLRGLHDYLSSRLHIPASPGELWIMSNRGKNVRIDARPFTQHEHNLYAGAIGLALRGSGYTTLSEGVNFMK